MTHLDRLEALAEKATPRPWKVANLLDPAVTMWTGASQGAIEDAEFIVATVNALLDLIRVARAAKAASDKWINEPAGYAPPMAVLAKALVPLFAEAES